MLKLPHCTDNMCCGCDSRWDQLVDVAICATLAPGLCGRPKEMLTEKLSSEYKLRLSGTHAHTIEHSYHVHRHEHSHTHGSALSTFNCRYDFAITLQQQQYNDADICWKFQVHWCACVCFTKCNYLTCTSFI